MTRRKERAIELGLRLSAWLSILSTGLILLILTREALLFFHDVPVFQFLTDTQWTPLFSEKHYGILPLLAGTLLTSFIAICLALPIGLSIAIYLNEYSPRRLRNILKPLLELLAAIPSIVYGFFALTMVTPFLQGFIPGMAGFNALSAGLVMGIMIIPYVSSLSEDALYSLPASLREASYGLGSTRLQTVFRITLPAAGPGIRVAIILAISRAIGETMIVAIAAGQQPRLTANPLVPIETISAYIVQVSMGDVPHASAEYRTIFAAGMALFLFTFLLNNLSYWLRKRFREKYR